MASGLTPARATTVTETDLVKAFTTAPRESPPHGLRVLAVLSALMGFASISTDFYLPPLPTMASALRSDAGTMEFTISGYLVGFSLGQLVWGPVGACAGVVLARAMLRDVYAGNRAAQMLSTLITAMAIAPLLGPILGAEIMALAGWRAIFWTLVGVGLLTPAALASLPETLPAERRNREPLSGAFARCGALLRDRRLLGYAGVGGFLDAGMFAYIAGSPFAYITYHHVPPQLYGLLFGVGIVGIMAPTSSTPGW